MRNTPPTVLAAVLVLSLITLVYALPGPNYQIWGEVTDSDGGQVNDCNVNISGSVSGQLWGGACTPAGDNWYDTGPTLPIERGEAITVTCNDSLNSFTGSNTGVVPPSGKTLKIDCVTYTQGAASTTKPIIKSTTVGSSYGTTTTIAAVVKPSCSDGVQNQGEEDVDCGGPCLACPAPSRLPLVIAILAGGGIALAFVCIISWNIYKGGKVYSISKSRRR